MFDWSWPQQTQLVTGHCLRDEIAMRILPEIYRQLHEFPEDWRLGLAKDAYKMADAMLKAREDDCTQGP